MAERRVNFQIARRFVPLKSLIFLDESGAQSNLTRLYGRAPKDQRCLDHTPHGHWKNTTMLSAIRLDGVIREATITVDAAIDGSTFTTYVEDCLAPVLRRGDVA